ncbi:MAG: M28 family peptidase [Elusimicrobia bacterium]|nr:M28 family peptidase [Elusimicrobiota bacterium]
MKAAAAVLALSLILPCAHGAGKPRRGAQPKSYAILKDLLRLGHRHAGAPKRARTLERLAGLLRERGLQVESQSFESPDPRTGKSWPMTNIVGRFRPESSCRFLMGSHFDARHEAEMDPDPERKTKPITGANDSGSGVAVLLSLAERFSDVVPEGVGVDVVLFDGEEMGYPDAGGYCAGSRFFAEKLAPAAQGAKPRFGIVLDMVASPKTVFKVESYSHQAHPGLVEALWELGSGRDPSAFSRERWGWIRDDHVPLTAAGVPSVLVIGFNDPRWHTSKDVLAGLSPERLALVEGMLEDFMRSRLQPFLGGCP